MVLSTAIIAQTEQELLHELAKHAYGLERSDFSQVGKIGVYGVPPRSSRAVSLDGYNHVLEEGIIRGLNLKRQLALLHLLSERFGIPLRHLTLGENFDSAYSPNGQQYKEKVLKPFWVYTGEIISKRNDDAALREVLGLETTAGLTQLVIPDRSSSDGYRSVNINVPSKTGYFEKLSGPLPTDSDITQERPSSKRGYWNGTHFDENNLSAVGCLWNSVVQGLVAVAYWPLFRGDYGVLGIGTDAPLNK